MTPYTHHSSHHSCNHPLRLLRNQLTLLPHLAGMAEKKDTVRATCKETQRILATSHNIWSSYAEPSNLGDGFPPECVQLRNILGPVPSYLADRLIDFNSTRLKLKHKRVKDNEYELLTEGTSL